MASITDNLKDGLKYPLYEPKKIGLLAALYCIIFALFFASLYVFIGSLEQAVNVHMLVEGSKMLPTFLSSSSIAEIIIFLIITVIVSLFITGYLYEIIKFTIEGKNNLPKFDNFKNMFINGVKVTVVMVVYSIVPSILSNISVKLSSSQPTIALVVGIIAIILGIVLTLMGIMAINNMAANNNNFKSAFDRKGILALISSIGWIRFIGALVFLALVGLIILFAALFVSFIIAIILSFAGEIGSYIGLFIALIILVLVISYLEIVTYRFYGSLYKEAIKE